MKPAVVVFDLFGTLLNIASLRDAAAPLVSEPDAFVATWREKQIGYAFASAIMSVHEDFDAMTDYGLRYAAEKHGVALDEQKRKWLVAAWENVRAYDDVVSTLRDLRERGVRCAVLTNGTPSTAKAAIAHAGIADLLDATLSVESAGVFKPDRRVYELVTAHYHMPAEHVVFVSSNGWDATGAALFGMRVAWCNRGGVPAETFGPTPEWVLRDLRGLPAIVDALSFSSA
jgi:2-haloacid dehalogenase